MTLLQTVFAQIHEECAKQIQTTIQRQNDINAMEQVIEACHSAGIHCTPDVSTGNGYVRLFLNIDYADCDTTAMREILNKHGLKLSTSHYADRPLIHTATRIEQPTERVFQFYNTPHEAMREAA